MGRRKNRWLKMALGLALASLAVSCDRSNKQLDTPHLAQGTANLPAAPAVSFQNLDGKTVDLAAYRGKVVLVNFWGTWCGACMAELPDLIEFQQEYGSKGFTVLGVAMNDTKASVRSFVTQRQFDVGGRSMAMNYPVVLGSSADAAKLGCCFGFPTSYIISRDGKIAQKIIGPVDPKAVSGLIRELL